MNIFDAFELDVNVVNFVYYGKTRLCVCRSKIEFRPVENLKKVAHRLDVDNHGPSHMCAVTSSPSQLLFHDYRTGRVHQVDCSDTSPIILGQISVVRNFRDMCTSDNLLVVTSYDEGVFAYHLNGFNWEKGHKWIWRVSGKLPGMQHEIRASGVTTDGQGHLFICDFNNKCVHALSIQGGKHLGVVVREGEEGLGTPYKVTWHRESASLVVINEKDGVYHLSIFSH